MYDHQLRVGAPDMGRSNVSRGIEPESRIPTQVMHNIPQKIPTHTPSEDNSASISAGLA